MSSHSLVQRFLQLDSSSSKLPDQLSNILYGKEYERSVSNVQGDELLQLVDRLDEVCRSISLRSPAQAAIVSRFSRPRQFRFSEVSSRTQTHMRHQNDITNIACAFVFVPHCDHRSSAGCFGGFW